MKQIGPGACIGILGGGQLARMLAVEARRMGYRVAICDPDAECPGAAVADSFVQGELNDPDAVERLARISDVVTLDTEHVPAALLRHVETFKPMRPSSGVLELIQDRLRQRQFLAEQGLPQVVHAAVSERGELDDAMAHVGLPCVMKVRRSGYDGKGQCVARDFDELVRGWDAIGGQPAMLESHVDFACEISVILARDLAGSISFFPIALNWHKRHVLHMTLVPVELPAHLSELALDLSARIASGLQHVGVMAVEFFVTRDERLLVNEIAPRTHNSGHFTLGACLTSQFEQHIRAICGLPLADPGLVRPAAMLNLLGDLWRNGPPDWSRVLSHPQARLHLYGKRRATPGRKMGHVLVLDEQLLRAREVASSIADSLE